MFKNFIGLNTIPIPVPPQYPDDPKFKFNFYCSRPINARRAIQPVCRNGCYRTGGLPPRTLPFLPFDANKPPQKLVAPCSGSGCGFPPMTCDCDALYALCGQKPEESLVDTVSGVRWTEERQQLRLKRRNQGCCCPAPEAAKYMRQPPGRGFVATPESAVRMQMIKMMRCGQACDAGCTAKGQEDQDRINRAGCPCPVNIHISADQLARAGTKPYHEIEIGPLGKDQECGLKSEYKFFPLNWEDILVTKGCKTGMKRKVDTCCGPLNTNVTMAGLSIAEQRCINDCETGGRCMGIRN